MFFPEGRIRVQLYGQPVDMRKSFDGLSALAAHAMGCDPLSGALFVFINRRATQVKVLYFDRSGYCVWAKRIASHARSRLRGGYTTIAEHMPASHRSHREWSPARFLRWSEEIGTATAQLVEHLLTDKPHPEMGYRSCLGLLSLARNFGAPRLEAACVRAIASGARTRRSVLSILQRGLDQQPLPNAQPQADWISPAHDNLRGPAYYRNPTTNH